MATGTRALTLKLLADVDNFTKNLNKADQDVQGFGDKISKFGKIAGGAFLAAGAAATVYAGKLAVDGVKAAIADEAAQATLAKTLENTTNATKDQIKQVENYITKTSLAKGVTDEVLRPSLDRLIRSTKDVQEAQRLQNLALDISAGTGKNLASVSEALAKAHDGNFTALKKLGVPLDDNITKTKNFDEAQKALADTFAGQATTKAETFAGKMDRLKIAFDETKETVGSFILDAITPILNTIVQKVIPAVQGFIDSIGGTDGIGNVMSLFIDAAKKFFIPVFDGIKKAFDRISDSVKGNQDEFKALLDFATKYLLPFFGKTLKLAIEGIGIAVSGVIEFVGTLIRTFQRLIDIFNAAKKLIGGIGGAVGDFFGGSSTSSTSSVPKVSSVTVPKVTQASSQTNITVNGAIDPEGTARTIVSVLNNSAARGTLGAAGFAY